MRVGVIGINHKLANLKLREAFARICEQRFCSGKSAHIDHSLISLSTCNRSEVYFTSEDLANTHSYILNIFRQDWQNSEETFDQNLYSYFGHDCFKHLARVTSGLDSAIVAETEIQGQVKAAYENTLKYLELPYEMHFLFQKSLKIGKKIRSELPLGRGIPNLEQAILNTGHQTFENVESANILFIGASEINSKVLAFLKKRNFKNITLCNRSQLPGERIKQKYQIDLLDWSKLSHWVEYDWIIFGTKSPQPIITKEDDFPLFSTHKLILDLSVPRNVDPKLKTHPQISLFNIDQLNQSLKNRKKKLHDVLSKAEAIVDEATKQQIEFFSFKTEKKNRLLAVS